MKGNFFIEVPVKIYERYVVAFIGTPDELREAVKPMFAQTEQWVDTCRNAEGCGGFCIGMSGDRGDFELMFINTTIKPEQIEPVIWHETLHASLNILCGIGGRVGAEDQEPLAYLQGHIATEIIKKLKAKQKNSKKRTKKRNERDSESVSTCKTSKVTSKVSKRVTERYRASLLKGGKN